MNNQIQSIGNQLQNQVQNGAVSSSQVQEVLQTISGGNANQSVEEIRARIAKAESLIQDAITSIENMPEQVGLAQSLDQLQIELMNYSQSLEQRELSQNQSTSIPGEPLNTDQDPAPGTIQ